MTTSTTSGARDHARAQEVTESPIAPPAGVDHLTWADVVPGGGYTHKVLTRGSMLRLTDLRGAACAHVLLYNAEGPWERLNVADTVKVQWNAYLGVGGLLLSDQGRALASIAADSAAHDTLCGTSPLGRSLFTLAAAKHGLTQRDLPNSLSFFRDVHVEPNGDLTPSADQQAGASITLRMELPVIVLIANVPHPLTPDADCTELEVAAWRDHATRPTDPLWSATPEGRRAFENTHAYLDAKGLA
jgi:uncharacterized protein YcgI (DUF1989 family)